MVNACHRVDADGKHGAPVATGAIQSIEMGILNG